MTTFTKRAAICACVLSVVFVGVVDAHPREQAENLPVHWREPGVDLHEQRGRSMEDFLSVDGQFDLEAIRRSGYQGPLDLGAHRVRIDPRSGRLVVGDKAQEGGRDHPDDIYWQPGMGMPGVNGPVYATIVYDNALIVGGLFSLAGDVLANNIARWDGAVWSALGSGTNGAVFALAVYDGVLIAGGEFTTAGGVPANGIARWDRADWSALGPGMNYGVRALAVYNNTLVAGGSFTTAGGGAANFIAQWDGTEWSPLGSEMNGSVVALADYEDVMIVGGFFRRQAARYLFPWLSGPYR